MSRDKQKHYLIPSVMLTTNAWKRTSPPKQEEPVSVVEALKLVGEKIEEIEKKLDEKEKKPQKEEEPSKKEKEEEKNLVEEKKEQIPSEEKKVVEKQKIHYDPLGRKQDLFNLALQNHLPVTDQHTKAQIINMIVEHNNSL